MPYHIQVHRSSKQKHGGYLNSPDVYRGTGRPDSRRLCHTMALRGGETASAHRSCAAFTGCRTYLRRGLHVRVRFTPMHISMQNCRPKLRYGCDTTVCTEKRLALPSMSDRKFPEGDVFDWKDGRVGLMLPVTLI